MKIYLPNPIIELGKIILKEPISVEMTYLDAENHLVFYEWDFGMESYFDYKTNFCDINKIAKLEDKIIRICQFDLGHAFFHCEDDPNYTATHWALKGWYKDKVILEEDYE